jgi:hypothetical protein
MVKRRTLTRFGCLSLGMDPFFENYWNLDQIHGWAETRDPEIVRAAAWPRYGRPKKTLEIMIPVTHSATALLRDDRDIDGELWAASGWPSKTQKFEPTPFAQGYVDRHGVPAYQVSLYKNHHIHWPFNPNTKKLAHAWKFAAETDRALTVDITLEHFENNAAILTDPRLAELAPSLARVLREAITSPEVQGPPHVFRRNPFPTLDYVKHLFQEERLQALANRPNELEAVAISKPNWSGLEIGVGGEYQRLGVWTRGRISITGYGEFENVRVSRAEVLREFPAELPQAENPSPEAVSDDEIVEIIRAASERNGGFIGQDAGAKLVRRRFPKVPRDKARKFVKRVTGSDKPGPKGPRRRGA